MSLDKKSRQLARSLFKLSLEDGRVSESRVSEILAWVDRERPHQSVVLLREFLRLVTNEINLSVARVEHAGDFSADALGRLAETFSQRYGRPIEATATVNRNLIAGLRVQIGCDVYENSVAAQLAALEHTSL
jgi:F-type H+-transporting ATPase subunit delta